MNKVEFLDALRQRLAGMSPVEIDDVITDYTTHFTDGVAAGRSEEEIAAALGDPVRLARELRAEAGFRRWEKARTPANFFAVLFGLLALFTVDFIFLLPVLGGLIFFTVIAAIVVAVLCLVGAGLVMNLLPWGESFMTSHALVRGFWGLSLLGFGVGSGALLLWMVETVMRLLGRFARLHFTLLNRANKAA